MHYLNNLRILAEPAKEPQRLIPWLRHPHSLTDKLQSLKSSISLQLLFQQWIKPTWWDKYVLSIEDEFIFQREIIMESQHVAYWYARAIIPKSCYDLDQMFFKRLEKESIRNLIFDSQEVHRVDFIAYPVDKECIEFHWANKHLSGVQGKLWVRFAEFSFQNKASFYLLEILSPELEGAS